MAADVFYAIGSTHHVCQDFAVANGDFVILSDGCSSAKDSDWGARLLVKACHNVIKERSKPLSMDFTILKNAVLTLANSYVKTLDLNKYGRTVADTTTLGFTNQDIQKGARLSSRV